MRTRFSWASCLIQFLYFVSTVPSVMQLKPDDMCSVPFSIPKNIALQISLCKDLPKNWFRYLQKAIENKFMPCYSLQLNLTCKPVSYLRFFSTLAKSFNIYTSGHLSLVNYTHFEKRHTVHVNVHSDKVIGAKFEQYFEQTYITYFDNHSISVVTSPSGHVRLAQDNMIQQHHHVVQQCVKQSYFLFKFRLQNIFALNMTFCKLYFSKSFVHSLHGNMSIAHPRHKLRKETYWAILSKFSLHWNTQMINIHLQTTECQYYELDFVFGVIDMDSLHGYIGGTTYDIVPQFGKLQSFIRIICRQAMGQYVFVKLVKLYKIRFNILAQMPNLLGSLLFFNGPDFELPVVKQSQKNTVLLKTFQGSVQMVYNMYDH